MEQNVVDSELAQRDPGMCVCKGGPTLEILKDIQRLYEEKMELLEDTGGSGKLHLQVELLRSWVSDLVGQNTLLARAVEELEQEATTKLLLERRKNAEVMSELRAECTALRRRLARKDSDLRGLVEVLRRLREFDYCTLDGIHFFEVTESDIFGSVQWTSKNMCVKVSEMKILNETLHKENVAKDREIRQLNKDAQSYEQTIMNLRREMSNCKYHTPEVPKKDAEVMAGMCCTGTECGEWEPVKDFSELLRDETQKYQERIQKMEANCKSTGDNVRALRKVNVTLSEEMHSMRRVCAALDEQCRAANMRAQFKDDIIKEMRRQLKQAKAKASTSYEGPASFHAATSTPNTSLCECAASAPNPNLSVIERSTSAPILVSDASVADLQRNFKKCKHVHHKESQSSSCLRDKSTGTFPKPSVAPCAQTSGPPAKSDKSECVEELYVNAEAKKSAASSPRSHCINKKFQVDRQVKPTMCSAVTVKIEKDVATKSCGKNVKDSSGTCSLVDSASATCDASARAGYYMNKLMSTLQILQNKEDTIRVQAESLSVAEARIAALNERACEQRRELDRKTKEYQTLRKYKDCCNVEKTDVCIVTDKPMENQSDIVNTLQNNLCVIEDLYRECFYETAKQENLIEMLRSSYLDVRLMDRRKADQIGRLQTVINTQKLSLERCEDIALEVDSLKMDISNFLHSSTSTNNDSGMWERSEESFASAPGVQEDLQDIMEQLLRLQDLLTTSCSCGFEEKYMKSVQEIESLEIKIGELRGRICELECTLVSKNSTDTTYKAEIETKEKELTRIREQLLALEEGSKDQISTCDTLSVQLRNKEVLLDEKTAEVQRLQQQLDLQANKMKELQEDLKKADSLIKENCKMQSEVSYLTTQVSLWRAQLSESEQRVHALEAELSRTRQHCAHIDACYREKASNVAELQASLEQAHARGAALCGQARAAVRAVRHWVRRMREKQRDLYNVIKDKDVLIAALQRRQEDRQSDTQHTSGSDNTATCSKCLSSRNERSLYSKAGERREKCHVPSASEMPSCSSTPVPPAQLLPRKKPCAKKRCKAWICDATIPEPPRAAGSGACGAAGGSASLRT